MFLDTDENKNPDKILVVTAAAKEQLLTVGGDWENTVAEVTLSATDPRIVGYVNVYAQQPTSFSLSQATTVSDSSDLVGSFLTTTNKNSWQIVSEGYLGREEAHKTGNESVLVQKNVVPTAIENEFLIYLSIDKKLSWNTVFEYGIYYASAANGSIGEVTSLNQGNAEQLLTEPSGSSSSSFYMVIQIWNDKKTQLLSESEVITRYSNKSMKNGQILLQVPDTNQALVVGKVRDYQGTSATNPVYIELTESMVSADHGAGFEKISVIDTILDSVVDVMGENIEFVEVLAGDYTTMPQFEKGVLTWHPKPSAMTAGEGSGEKWQRNAAQLVYKIRLKNDKSCLACLDTTCSLTGCDHVYPTNQSAVLNYHFSNTPDTTLRMNFQTPYVRGLLYDIHFTKVDEDFGFPLMDAVFRLTNEGDQTFVPIEITSSKTGAVSFENLLPGKYTLTEISAPSGYVITFGDTQKSIDIVLNYTDNPAYLMVDTYEDTHADKFMYKGAEDGDWKITNKSTNIFVELPATGGIGTYLYTLCGLTLVIGPFVYGFSLRYKYKRKTKQ